MSIEIKNLDFQESTIRTLTSDETADVLGGQRPIGAGQITPAARPSEYPPEILNLFNNSNKEFVDGTAVWRLFENGAIERVQ